MYNIMENKIELFQQKLIEFAQIANSINVPVGFTVTDTGKFLLKYSLNATGKLFTSVEELMDFVLEERLYNRIT